MAFFTSAITTLQTLVVALGAGATTKAVFPGGRIERVENVKDVTNYIDRIDEMIERKRKGINTWL